MIYEIRRYQARSGRRDEWVRYREQVVIPFQQSRGMTVTASFVDDQDPDGYVWIRRFNDEAQRVALHAATYDSDRWKNEIAPAVDELLLLDQSVITRVVPPPRPRCTDTNQPHEHDINLHGPHDLQLLVRGQDVGGALGAFAFTHAVIDDNPPHAHMSFAKIIYILNGSTSSGSGTRPSPAAPEPRSSFRKAVSTPSRPPRAAGCSSSARHRETKNCSSGCPSWGHRRRRSSWPS